MSRGRLELRGLKKMKRLITDEKPDVVQTWMYHSDLIGGLIARMAGVKAISWGIHNSNLSLSVAPKKSILTAYICAVTDRWIPSHIISCSEYAAKVHRRIGYNSRKLSVVHNGYDMNKFSIDNVVRCQVRAELNVSEDCIVLGMIARWHKVKDHSNLLHAMSYVKQKIDRPWMLILAGDAMDENNSELALLWQIRKIGT